MKKVLLGLTIVCLIASVKAQTYYPFVTENKIWSVLEGDMGGGHTTWFKFLGDTLINGKIYKQTYYSNDSLMQYWSKYFCYIREDSEKVYRLQNNVENLIYDFSLSKGDSINTNYQLGGQPVFVKVDTVDYVLINGSSRKRINFRNFINEVWIEGIGSSWTPFDPFINYFIYDIGFSLVCVIDKDTLIYHDYGYPTCFLDYVNGIENYKTKSEFSISPNPFSTSTQITLSQTYHQIALSVYDIQGKLVTQNQYKDTDKIQLNRKGLNNGMYFLRLVLDDKEVATGKIVVSD